MLSFAFQHLPVTLHTHMVWVYFETKYHNIKFIAVLRSTSRNGLWLCHPTLSITSALWLSLLCLNSSKKNMCWKSQSFLLSSCEYLQNSPRIQLLTFLLVRKRIKYLMDKFFLVQVAPALPLHHHSNEFFKLTGQYGFKALLCSGEIATDLHPYLKPKENTSGLLEHPVNCLPGQGGYQDRVIS